MADTRDVTRLVVLRHGQTEWSLSGRHTGRSDIPLTQEGRRQAAAAASRLEGLAFDRVWTSPLSRTTETARLAGLHDAEPRNDLAEWDYGEYDGRTTVEIREGRPGWEIFRDGVVGGESIEEVTERVDRVIEDARSIAGDVLVVSHGHLSRVLTARWLGLDASHGRTFSISPASLSILGWKRELPVVLRWNDACHLEEEWSSQAVFPD